jgi:uncharacterized protein YbcI
VKEDIIEKKTQFSLKGITNWVEVFFSRDRTTRQTVRLKADSLVNEIVKTFNSTVSSIENASGKRIVIILDDLEKVTDESRMIDILLKHSNVIRGLNCHIVLTVPPSIFYSPLSRQIGQTYGITYFLPPFQVRNKDGTYNVSEINLMQKIIDKRISGDLLTADLLQNTAKRSGGIIIDFMRMLKLSLGKTYDRGESHVTESNLNEAFNSLVDDFDKIISPDEYELLAIIHHEKEPRSKNAKFRELLFNLIVLEYNERGTSWYGLHPAVEQLLKKKNKI